MSVTPYSRSLPDSVSVRDADPPSTLTPDSYAARLYAALAPLAHRDDEVGWSLLILCNAVGSMFQLVEDLVRDSPDGPGWSVLMDLDRCPPVALAWLAQFVGVRLLPGATDAQNRERIDSTAGFNRGTRDALIGAARATLTGPRTVFISERDGNPAVAPDYAYYLTVTTYNDQTPNPALTEAAIRAQKPAGLVLTYTHVTGQTYAQVRTINATYAALKTRYATYADVRDDEPA